MRPVLNDDERRLYYVAMTRARKTLCLARFEHKRHPLLDDLGDGPHLLRRSGTELPPPPAALARRHLIPSPAEVDIGYAGRKPAKDPLHAAIADLTPGAPLRLVAKDEVWRLLNSDDRCVGKMAKSFSPPAGMSCIDASVHSILVRDKFQADPNYAAPRCERWEIVLPKLVFAPADGG